MGTDYTRETPIDLLGKILATIASGAFLFALGAGVWFGIGWLIDAQRADNRAFYASCVERGGLITEGGISGRECVGVKTPRL